jgi:hypothetical protein
MRNAITVHAVMAFSLLATPAFTQEDTRAFGNAEPCANTYLARLIPAAGGSARVLATYVESGSEKSWLRILQQGSRFTLESSSPRAPRKDIDRALAERVHAGLAADLARNAFAVVSDQPQVDGVWYLFTADGLTCATLPWLHRDSRVSQWAMVFWALFDLNQPVARMWLDHLEEKPATFPTLLDLSAGERQIPGAGSVWSSPGAAPLAIVSHRVRIKNGDERIVGELRNNMNAARNGIRIIATFFDAAGSVLATQETGLGFAVLPRGDRSPFDLKLPPQRAASYTLRVDPGNEIPLRAASVQVLRHKAKNGGAQLIVSGTVRNDGPADEKRIEPCVNLYDDTGNLLASGRSVVAAPLKAGASAAFAVSLERPPNYHHYEVLVNPDYREQKPQ